MFWIYLLVFSIFSPLFSMAQDQQTKKQTDAQMFIRLLQCRNELSGSDRSFLDALTSSNSKVDSDRLALRHTQSKNSKHSKIINKKNKKKRLKKKRRCCCFC